MPSTVSSSVPTPCESSTVMTPSLPTLSMASAISSPMVSSCEEIAATCATSSCPLTGMDSFLISSTTASTAFSMPTLSCIGLAPAVTFLKPSLIIVWARIVAVVVPSPATSLVLVATSRKSCAPVFSCGSWRSSARTMVTPSLVTVGAPYFFSSTTLRPLGPSVMRTVLATVSMPRLRPCRASTSNAPAFAMVYLLARLLLGRGGLAGDHGQHVLLADDQVLDVLDLELASRVLGVEHAVTDLELHGQPGAIVKGPARADSLDQAFLGLLLGGVGQNDAALGHVLALDRRYYHAITERFQVHGVSSPPRACGSQWQPRDHRCSWPQIAASSCRTACDIHTPAVPDVVAPLADAGPELFRSRICRRPHASGSIGPFHRAPRASC